MSEITSESKLTTKEIVEQAIQDYHRTILPYLAKGNGGTNDTPLGAVQFFDDTVAPSGWLVADGTTYNIADYPFLANHYERVHGSKNYWGGNGTTTFAVPDWQGEFLRASGPNAHPNQGDGAAVGEHQDATEHLGAGMESNNLGYIASTPNGGAFAEKYDTVFTDGTIRTFNSAGFASNSYKRYTSRPVNTSLLLCIKATPAGHNYSTEEQVVGTWIDRKPLYQKTYKLNSSIPVANNRWTSTEIQDSSIEKCIEGKMYDTFGTVFNCEIAVINNYINLETTRYDGSVSSIIAFTIQYTKTTDTAIS